MSSGFLSRRIAGYPARKCLAATSYRPNFSSPKISFLLNILECRDSKCWDLDSVIMDLYIQARLFIIYLAVAACYTSLADAQCYYPGGTWAKDQFPCDKYAYTTLCCPTGWTCFSNNLCIVTDPSIISSNLPLGTAIRSTCTNPLWNNTVCGDFCLSKSI
jgi:hypothetical protein